MRLVLALKIDKPENPNELALAVMSCLDTLPIPFSSIIAFTPDDGLTATVEYLNKFFAGKRNDQAGNGKA